MKTAEQRRLEDAEYEAERLRDQLDHERRRAQQRADEGERERKEEMRRSHPSYRLYNGEVSDFNEAVRLRMACLQGEITRPAAGDDEEMRKTIEKCNAAMREGIEEAQRAQKIYDDIVSGAKARAVEEMRKAGLTDWADCLASDDYSDMAV